MENNSPDRTPVLPIVENIPQEPPTINQTIINPVKPKKSAFFPFLTVFLIIAAFFLGYFFNKQNSASLADKTTNQEKTTESPEASPTASITPVNQKVPTEFLFVTDPNKDVAYDLQAWLLSMDGEKKKVDLPDFSTVFKYPDSSKIFFIENVAPLQTDVRGTISIKDTLSGEMKKYELVNHPKPEVSESITINSLNNIAPDGSMLVYGVFFSEPCPPVTIEPGFEGGFGPCEPSPEPNLPNGDYVYDFATKTNTSLGESVIVSKWDLENKKLYFISMEYQKNGLKVMDLETKQISMLSPAQTFG